MLGAIPSLFYSYLNDVRAKQYVCLSPHYRDCLNPYFRIVDQQLTTFPAVTLCPNYALKNDVLKAHGISNGWYGYNGRGSIISSSDPATYDLGLTWSSNDSSIGEEEFFKLVTKSQDDTIKFLEITTLQR